MSLEKVTVQSVLASGFVRRNKWSVQEIFMDEEAQYQKLILKLKALSNIKGFN